MQWREMRDNKRLYESKQEELAAETKDVRMTEDMSAVDEDKRRGGEH